MKARFSRGSRPLQLASLVYAERSAQATAGRRVWTALVSVNTADPKPSPEARSLTSPACFVAWTKTMHCPLNALRAAEFGEVGLSASRQLGSPFPTPIIFPAPDKENWM